MIELFLFAAGVELELYEAPYGVFRQEILLADSPLYKFAPKAVFIATSWRDLGQFPELGEDAASVDQRVIAEQSQWSALWETLHKRLNCQVIQNNFDRPAWRQLGNHEPRHVASNGRFTSLMNASFAASARPYVAIHDIDELSAAIGRRTWGDETFFHHAKLPCAPESLGEYAHSVASLLLAQKLRARQKMPRARPRQHPLGRRDWRRRPRRHSHRARRPGRRSLRRVSAIRVEVEAAGRHPRSL